MWFVWLLQSYASPHWGWGGGGEDLIQDQHLAQFVFHRISLIRMKVPKASGSLPTPSMVEETVEPRAGPQPGISLNDLIPMGEIIPELSWSQAI